MGQSLCDGCLPAAEDTETPQVYDHTLRNRVMASGIKRMELYRRCDSLMKRYFFGNLSPV